MRMAKLALLILLLFAAAGFGGCEEVPPATHVSPPRASEPLASCGDGPTLNVVTWNVALGPGMNPLRRPRAPHVAAALGETEFDVLCLQELWTDHDRDLVVEALNLPPEHLLLPDTVGQGENGTDKCGPVEAAMAVACARERCSGLDTDDIATCVQKSCFAVLAPLALMDRSCLNCLIATAGHGPDDVRRICTQQGASRIHGGRTGLLLASRWPLTDRETMLVRATSANRAGLFATVHVPGISEPIEVACTHLAASSKDLSPYHSELKTWHEEKRSELDAISERLARRAKGRPQLLIGDYNIAPMPGTNEPSGPDDLWQRVLDLGFRPTPLAAAPVCTSCSDNTFRRGQNSRVNDHALLRDPVGGAELEVCYGQRLFDRPVLVESRRRSGLVETNLSDHYGVRTVFVAPVHQSGP